MDLGDCLNMVYVSIYWSTDTRLYDAHDRPLVNGFVAPLGSATVFAMHRESMSLVVYNFIFNTFYILYRVVSLLARPTSYERKKTVYHSQFVC